MLSILLDQLINPSYPDTLLLTIYYTYICLLKLTKMGLKEMF